MTRSGSCSPKATPPSRPASSTPRSPDSRRCWKTGAGFAAAGDLYLRLGETNRRKGDLDSAIRYLARANELLPGNAVVIGTLALALDGSGNHADAQRAYRATLEIDPNNAIAMNNLAFLLAEGGSDLDEALKLVTRAMEMAPDSPQMIDTAGWVRLKRGENDSAIALFADAVAKEPADETFRDHLLMALERKGDHTGILGDDHLRAQTGSFTG